MGLDARPYIGTWRLSGKQLIQSTPDAIVYLNGDTSIPGCSKCSGRIDIQRFLTEVSVDAGTLPGSASASFSLSIPLHHTESFARDAKFLMKPGLEVHVYMRGYFPVAGLYKGLAEGKLQGEISSLDNVTPVQIEAAALPDPTSTGPHSADEVLGGHEVNADVQANAEITASMINTLESYLQQRFPGAKVTITRNGGVSPGSHSKTGQHPKGAAVDLVANANGGVISGTDLWRSVEKLRSTGYLPAGGIGAYVGGNSTPEIPNYLDYIHMDHRSGSAWWVFDQTSQTDVPHSTAYRNGLLSGVEGLPAPDDTVQGYNQAEPPPAVEPPATTAGIKDDTLEIATSAEMGPSLLEEKGLAGLGIENTLAYPYYHVFHGVVTEVSHSYSGGVNNISVNCSSMLHFWQYQNMSTNASLFGARPTNSKLKMSLVGHNFTGMHPYQIMYTLHHDMVGAAGGVAWALANKTNQTAVSDVGQETLFSLNIRYWQKRFSGRAIRLRMHGATGDLFSTMAAAWLGRTSSTSIMSLMRGRYSTTKPSRVKGVLEQSIAVGLYNAGKRKALKATQFADASTGSTTNSPKFGINIVEMQAFVSNIGNWGQVNLFESTYESKLDVAQKVMEITGFEFYQDVDGDFVFKPPMWNLDTSGSRVYRIEDIDIINISISEKEPQVTYMVCKGSQFKNTQGTGLENEWGVRGQYIDYRLVAQFGWRPGSYETAYFNDSKSMFFSAVNRMDIMNIGINFANVTIPIRPEIRPGFPVYIPYLDAFYYCNSFAHSHAVGGRCTTTLQLVGKRAKFYPPGRRAGEGNFLTDVDLSNTTLPDRPIHVLGQDGEPKLSGFPNVVMALDPTAINPLFFVVGGDMEDLSDPQVIKGLLSFGVQERILTEGPDLPDGGKIYTMPSGHTTGAGDDAQPIVVRFYFQEGDINGTTSAPTTEPATEKAFNIIAEGIKYDKLVKATLVESKKNQKAVRRLKFTSLTKQAQKVALEQQPDFATEKVQAKINALEAEILKADAQLQKMVTQINRAKTALEASWRDPNDGQMRGVAFLLRMLDMVGEVYRTSDDFQGRGGLNSSINLLDMLSDKKAIFNNGSLPGSYRYYSASHPNPEHQGPRVFEYVSDAKKRIVDSDPAPIDGDKPLIKMFSPHPTAPFPGAIVPEAELIDGKPEVGVRVLNSNPHYAKGESLATSDILELMFSVQLVTAVTAVTTNFRTTSIGSLGKQARSKIAERLAPFRQATEVDTLDDVFKPQWDALNIRVQSGVDAMKKAGVAGNWQVGNFTVPVFPATIGVYKIRYSTSQDLGNLGYADNPGDPLNLIDLGPQGSKATLIQLVDRVAASLGTKFYRALEDIRRVAARALKASGAKGPESDKIIGVFNTALTSILGTSVSVSNRRKGRKTRRKTTETFSPVFPVSDDRGYEVIGSYRYGRNVDIEPGGVFDQLHKMDIFSLFDKTLVELILRFFVQGKKILIPEMETVDGPDGVSVTRPVDKGGMAVQSGSVTARYLNDEAVRQLRSRGLTDKQILDYGFLLQGDGDTGQLNFSLANIFTDQKLDGVQKMPLINAAYSLADMNLQQSGHICNCKAAEADVHILAFGQEQFLSFTQEGSSAHEGPNPNEADAGTRWIAQEASIASDAWRQQQEALRGQVLDRGGDHIVRQVTDALGIATGPSGNAFTDALGIQGLSEGVRTSVFQKTVNDSTGEGSPLQDAVDEARATGVRLEKP